MSGRNNNQFQKHHSQIQEMSSQGLNSKQMLEQLGLPVTKGSKEQLRRFLHSRGMKIAPQGGPSGDQNGWWNGGRTVDKSGYVLLKSADHPHQNNAGYVREHRLVMEEYLGRYLEPQEVVHHINGDKQDNRVENLEIFETNAQHLAETLKGQCPNWTEEGRQRTLEGARRPRPRLSAAGSSSPGQS